MNENKIFQILNSKWFMLFLGIGMILLLPITYENAKVIIDAGEVAKYWYLLAVFIINIITAVAALYKFASKAFTKKDDRPEW
jgi:hypothetical protein